MNTIYTTLYERPEIHKRLKPLNWAWICTAVGIICLYLILTQTSLSAGVNALLILGLSIGGIALLTLVCFYIMGDKWKPYHRPSKKMLESQQIYYSALVEKALVEAVQNKDHDALTRIKRSTTPDLLLVRFSDEEERVMYSQVIDNRGKEMTALTEVVEGVF